MPIRGKKTVAEGRPTRARPGVKKVIAVPFEPTGDQRGLVTMGIALGMTYEQLRQRIINPTTGRPISLDTLIKFFRPELDGGAQTIELALAGNLYRKAMGNGQGSVAASIFMLKARFGWKDRDWGDAEPLPEGDDGSIMPDKDDNGNVVSITMATA